MIVVDSEKYARAKNRGSGLAHITQEEVDNNDLIGRANILRSRGAPIPEGEIHFPDKYLVTIHVTESKVPGSWPALKYEYEWELKH